MIVYNFDDWKKFLKISNTEFSSIVRNLDWKRDIPGGWLSYSPNRSVCFYGNGKKCTDEGKLYGNEYKYTGWKSSVPTSHCTTITKTKNLPKKIISSGIIKAIRHLLRLNNINVNDFTGTGMWCNFYENKDDYISPHKDDEDYYSEPNYFVSLTLYDDELFEDFNLANFQIKKDSWENVKLPHLSLLIMKGDCEHRVNKSKINNFRKRYNITFRTPKIDIIKHYRFFSNGNRYYNKPFMLYVPEKMFINIPPKNKRLYYKQNNKTAKSQDNKQYKINFDNTYTTKVLEENSKINNLFLKLNLNISKDEIFKKINLLLDNDNYIKSAPQTTTIEALWQLYLFLNDNN